MQFHLIRAFRFYFIIKAIFDDMITQRLFYEQYKTDLMPPRTFEEFNRIARFFDHNLMLKSPIRYGTALIDNPEILALEFFSSLLLVSKQANSCTGCIGI